MKRIALYLFLPLIGFFGIASVHNAEAQNAQKTTGVEINKPMSPEERGELTRRFVVKWGAYVERTYGISVRVWANRMAPTFAMSDPFNFRNAIENPIFESAISELNGANRRTYTRLSETLRVETAYSTASTKALGDSVRDLVYTPVSPCRIVDTRTTSAGAIPANSSRSFLALSGNYTAQGGSGSGCGLAAASLVGAVAINVTSVTPSGPGYATVFPYNNTQPMTSSINYSTGSIVNNTIVTAIPNPLNSSDFTIYTFAQSHFVVDIVGYFSAPAATALQCTIGDSRTNNVQSGGFASVFPPPCPTGFAAVSTNCIAGSSQVNLSEVTLTACTARNNSSSVQTISAAYTCCRVPGR
jgi:hypothetical protein